MMLNLAWDTILMVTWFLAGYVVRGIRDERAAIKKMLDEAPSVRRSKFPKALEVMLGDRSIEDLRQLAALNENTTDLAAALRWAADRIEELTEANQGFHRVHQAWLYNEKPALESRIATLEAALRVITMLEIGTPLQDARIICRKALEEPSDDDSLPPGLVAELGLIPPWKPGDDGEFV
jgi:hypothetical protein